MFRVDIVFVIARKTVVWYGIRFVRPRVPNHFVAMIAPDVDFLRCKDGSVISQRQKCANCTIPRVVVPGEERMERTEFVNGYIIYYSQTQGEVCMERTEFVNGDTIYYSQTQGEERMVRKECADGYIFHYSGTQGEERMVRTECAHGIFHFELVRGQYRIVRVEYANGGIFHSKGVRGQERIVRRECARDKKRTGLGEQRRAKKNSTVNAAQTRAIIEDRLRTEARDADAHIAAKIEHMVAEIQRKLRIEAREEDERLVARLVEERRRTLIRAQRAARKAEKTTLTPNAVHAVAVVADAVHVVADAATTAKRTTRKAAARRAAAAHEEALRVHEADRVAHLEAQRATRRVGAAIGGH